MTYDFKVLPELGWALAIGAAIALFEIFVVFEPEAITDWETWGISGVGAVLRSAAIAGLAVVRRLAPGG